MFTDLHVSLTLVTCRKTRMVIIRFWCLPNSPTTWKASSISIPGSNHPTACHRVYVYIFNNGSDSNWGCRCSDVIWLPFADVEWNHVVHRVILIARDFGIKARALDSGSDWTSGNWNWKGPSTLFLISILFLLD